MNDIEQRLVTILDTRLGIPAADIEPESTFEELAVDSLIIVELALILRKELGVQIEDWEITPSMSIHEAAAFLATKGVVTA